MEENKRYLICDCAEDRWGKTETLKELICIFKKNEQDYSIIECHYVDDRKEDVWAAIEIKSSEQIIIIQTQGDYKKSYKETESYLETNKKKVRIVVCSARPANEKRKRDTGAYKKMIDISMRYSLNMILFRNAHNKNCDETFSKMLNESTAQWIYDLIHKQLLNK